MTFASPSGAQARACPGGACDGVLGAAADRMLGPTGALADNGALSAATFDPLAGPEDGNSTGESGTGNPAGDAGTTADGNGDAGGNNGSSGSTGSIIRPGGSSGGSGGGSSVFPVIINDPTKGLVPEPATWAMMVMGFGVVAHGLRRMPRRKAAPPAASDAA